jgi:hypothetical protein
MQFECALIGAARVSNHKHQLCAIMRAKEFGHIRDVFATYLKMQFVPAPDLEVNRPAFESFSQRGSEAREIRHFATTFTT